MNFLRVYIQVIRGIWRYFRGGWFVWRDASDSAVEWVASLDKAGQADPAELDLIESARDELALRNKRHRNEKIDI